MKLSNVILAMSLVATQSVFAQEMGSVDQLSATDGIESAQSALEVQYAELADLKEALESANANKNAAWIGVAISSASIAAGVFSLTERSMKAIGKSAITFSSTHRWSSGEGITSTLSLDDILIVGGAAGVLGSATIVAIESSYGSYLSKAISEQMEKIIATKDLILRN